MSDTLSWPIQWLAEYDVGIPQIDAQHRRLLEIANNLHGLRFSAKRWQGALEDLMAYTQYHFALEERLMSEAGFAGLADHRLAHEDLAERATTLWHNRDAANPEEVLNLLMSWLLTHILSCDQELRQVAGNLA